MESDRLVAIVAVFEGALVLFEKDSDATAQWMRTPVQGLGSKRPLEMMATRIETQAVFDLIGRLERGALV
jgi:putative toxin-antitoxin system antitoxin component (TIGR02293 family)